jgi:hypothetical protein
VSRNESVGYRRLANFLGRCRCRDRFACRTPACGLKVACESASAGSRRNWGSSVLHEPHAAPSLTEAGTFRAHAARICADVDLARKTPIPAGALRGRLRVAAPLSFGRIHFATVLAEMARRHPQLHIRFRPSLSMSFARQVSAVHRASEPSMSCWSNVSSRDRGPDPMLRETMTPPGDIDEVDQE